MTEDFKLKYQNIADYFVFVDSTDKDDGSKAMRFLCQKCMPAKKYYKTDTKAPMSNLRAHIKKVHGNFLSDFDLKMTSTPKRRRHVTADDNESQHKRKRLTEYFESEDSEQSKKPPALTKQSFHRAVVEFIINRKEPLTIVQDDSFKELMLKCHRNPELNLPCYRTVVKHVEDIFQISISKLKKLLEDVEYVSITTDGWSAVRYSIVKDSIKRK